MKYLATVNGTVGGALGKLYVDEKFPPEAKEKAEKMIANVIDAFKVRIEKLDWMTDTTKLKAIEKLDKFTVKIGYPDDWEDYSEMEVSADKSYFDNMAAVSKWSQQKQFEDIAEFGVTEFLLKIITFCSAAIFVIFIRLSSLFIQVRLGQVAPKIRIGHAAINPELYLCSLDAGLEKIKTQLFLFEIFLNSSR